MANRGILTPFRDISPLPVILEGLPILYEDEEEGDLGKTNPHVISEEILHICLLSHLSDSPQYRVYRNMNLYYFKDGPRQNGVLPYVSPDIMVVVPSRPLDENVESYEIETDGPPPVLVAEILSDRSEQQRDLTDKVDLYVKLGVAEYILVDVSGNLLPQRLLLKRLQPDRNWNDEQDSDGGITSQLGFRLTIEADGMLRVIHDGTAEPYYRPDEAVEAQQLIAKLQKEIARNKELVKKYKSIIRRRKKLLKRRQSK